MKVSSQGKCIWLLNLLDKFKYFLTLNLKISKDFFVYIKVLGGVLN